MGNTPRVLVLLTPSLFQQIFTVEADTALNRIAQVTRNNVESNFSSEQLASQIAGYDAVITGWGSPTFTEEVLGAADRLRLIAHTAGSIKKMLPPPVFEQGIAVTHAAGAIAPAVAEMTLLLILSCLRRVCQLDRMLKQGEPWNATRSVPMGQEIAGRRVGVLGAGYTGRRVIHLLEAVGADVWVCDPYLSEARANELGVRKTALDTLFAECSIVTLQAPPTTETYHMVGEKQLRLLQDDAVFINTARSHLVDQEALLAELRTGRFQAALDVFDQEPLPEDSPFRKLDNVILTPHVAGASRQARLRQGSSMVEELGRFFSGEALHYPVTLEMLDIMA